MATHSSILAWKNPWTEESGSLQSIGLALCCWIQSATLLLRGFASMFISDVGLYFSFCEIFVWFGCQGNAGFLE